MADKIRWGILSTARIGRNQVIPAIQASINGEVVAVASRDGEKAREFAAQLSIPTAHGAYDDLLADPNVDAIYNPLPNSMHAEWSIRAAEAGKHVLCEKPLASDATEAQQMVDAFKRHGVQLAEAFMYRFHPQTLRVHEMVNSGAVGTLHTIHATFTFPVSRDDDIRLLGSLAGGSIMDVGSYCVGVMRLMTGEEPIAVSAFGQFNDREADERAVGVLAFPSGVLGHFDCGVRSIKAHTYELRGTTGRIVVDEGFVVPKDRPTKIRYWRGDEYEEITFEPVNHYTLMAEDFADALLNNRPPRYPAEDAVLGMRLMDGLRSSAQSNRALVG